MELWSEKEIEILKENYKNHTVNELSEMLPRRTKRAIVYKIKNLKINKQKIWTKEDVEYLRENYSKCETKEIAKYFNVSEIQIRAAANRYKIPKERVWSQEEVDFLHERWGETPISAIAKKLGRSIPAVRSKAIKEKIGGYIENGSYITLMELCRTINDGDTAATYRKMLKLKIPCINKKIHCQRTKVIDINKFWKWAKENKGDLNFANFEENVLGKEPKWVKEKRKEDIQYKQRRGVWSKEEINMMIDLNKNFDITEISKRLNRSEGSIRKQLGLLNIKPNIGKPKKKYWTEEEINLLKQMIREGKQYNQIMLALGRNETTVRGKVQHLFNTNSLRKAREQLEME